MGAPSDLSPAYKPEPLILGQSQRHAACTNENKECKPTPAATWSLSYAHVLYVL
jgi:hypothetical protein